jgi:hypothetical protein
MEQGAGRRPRWAGQSGLSWVAFRKHRTITCRLEAGYHYDCDQEMICCATPYLYSRE